MNQEELTKTVVNHVEQILKEGQKNVTDLDSLIKLMRSPDLTIIGRSDLSISDIQSYTQYWETNYNQSQNHSSTTEMNYIITSTFDVFNKSGQLTEKIDEVVDETAFVNRTNTHIHVGRFYGHSFKAVSYTHLDVYKRQSFLIV